MRNKLSLKDLLIDTVEQMNHLEKLRNSFSKCTLRLTEMRDLVSYETLSKVHEYFGFGPEQ